MGGSRVIRMKSLVVFCVSLFVAAQAYCDVIKYKETFDVNNDTRDWATDENLIGQLFGANLDEDGALHSNTGGVTGGYDYSNYAWTAGHWGLLFADADASGGNLAGNKNYSSTPEVSSYMARNSTNYPTTSFFFASNNNASDSTLNTSSTIFYYNYSWSIVSSSWEYHTADLSDSSKWTRRRGSVEYANALADVDAIGLMFLDGTEAGTPELRVDNFATPEPGLLMTMAPLAGFIGWRVRRNRKRLPAKV